MRSWTLFLFLSPFLSANSSTIPTEIAVNSNRRLLFGDVLEPLCSVNVTGRDWTHSELLELFHTWQLVTSSQLATSSPISEFRKAMPCFPGPNVTSFGSEDVLPAFPSCDQFVNVSMSTIGEVEDLLKEVTKARGSRVDVSLKNVMGSLSNRLRNLIDFLPDGATRNRTKELLVSLTSLNSRPMLAEPVRRRGVEPSQLLACFNVTPSSLLALPANQSIGSIACERFSVCSFGSLVSNGCVSRFNISEEEFDWVANRTIGDLIGRGAREEEKSRGREKRTPAPRARCENCTAEARFDGSGGRSEGAEEDVRHSGEGSGEGVEHSEGSFNETDGYVDSLLSSGPHRDGRRRDDEGSGEGRFNGNGPDDVGSSEDDSKRRGGVLEGSGDVVPSDPSRYSGSFNEDRQEDVGSSDGRFNESEEVRGGLEDVLLSNDSLNSDGEQSEGARSSEDEEDLGNSTDTSDLLSLLSSTASSPDPSLFSVRLNSSLLQFVVSDLPESPLKLKISSVLSTLGTSEFTIGELWERLDMADSSGSIQLLNALKSVLGGRSEVTSVLESLKTADGADKLNLSDLLSNFNL